MTQDEPERVPIDPQEFLNFVEFLESVREETVNNETHELLLFVVSRTFAAHVYDEKHQDMQPQEVLSGFLTLMDGFAEYVLGQLPQIRHPNDLRDAIRRMKGMTEWWLNHFEERADRMSDKG